MSRVINKSGITAYCKQIKNSHSRRRRGLRYFLKRLEKQHVINENSCWAAGWTYPNTADKGRRRDAVNNYWRRLKSAIGYKQE
ncbi:MAG: hypothetical protein WCF23_12380 [Candidatus Nitrosopolaris sp.]